MSVADRAETDEVRPPSESNDRLPGPDVVRAVALIGVVVMNYHGYLMFRGQPFAVDDSTLDRFFDPCEGPLSTRFASTFVLTAGVGVTLLTRRVVADRAAGVEGAVARGRPRCGGGSCGAGSPCTSSVRCST